MIFDLCRALTKKLVRYSIYIYYSPMCMRRALERILFPRAASSFLMSRRHMQMSTEVSDFSSLKIQQTFEFSQGFQLAHTWPFSAFAILIDSFTYQIA